jgi:hypothetical protein
VATAVFFAAVALLGGPSSGDGYETLFTTWAIQHGNFSCAFTSKLAIAAPLYSVLAGGVAAVVNVGHGFPFPTASQMGAHCDTAPAAMGAWSLRAHAVLPTLYIGYLSWFPLMAGLVAWLRSCGRGRCGWEPATLMFIALLPPVWMSVESAFHPQDLMAMGLVLVALVLARRGSWMGAGVVIAMAVLTQQFALLLAVPLLVIAPSGKRLRYVLSALGTFLLIGLPLLSLSSGTATGTLLTGTGTSGGDGGTVLWEMHVRGSLPLLLGSRLPAIVVSVLLAWWFLRRFRSQVMAPIVLMSLTALCLSLRLVFETNLYGYYFVPLAVTLVLLDVQRRRVRGTLLAWLVMVTVVFTVGPIELQFWQLDWTTGWVRRWYPVTIIAISLGLLIYRVARRTLRWEMLVLVGLIAGTLLEWIVTFNRLQHPLANWFWQIALVGYGIMMVLRPLVVDGELPRPTLSRRNRLLASEPQ